MSLTTSNVFGNFYATQSTITTSGGSSVYYNDTTPGKYIIDSSFSSNVLNMFDLDSNTYWESGSSNVYGVILPLGTYSTSASSGTPYYAFDGNPLTEWTSIQFQKYVSYSSNVTTASTSNSANSFKAFQNNYSTWISNSYYGFITSDGYYSTSASSNISNSFNVWYTATSYGNVFSNSNISTTTINGYYGGVTLPSYSYSTSSGSSSGTNWYILSNVYGGNIIYNRFSANASSNASSANLAIDSNLSTFWTANSLYSSNLIFEPTLVYTTSNALSISPWITNGNDVIEYEIYPPVPIKNIIIKTSNRSTSGLYYTNGVLDGYTTMVYEVVKNPRITYTFTGYFYAIEDGEHSFTVSGNNSTFTLDSTTVDTTPEYQSNTIVTTMTASTFYRIDITVSESSAFTLNFTTPSLVPRMDGSGFYYSEPNLSPYNTDTPTNILVEGLSYFSTSTFTPTSTINTSVSIFTCATAPDGRTNRVSYTGNAIASYIQFENTHVMQVVNKDSFNFYGYFIGKTGGPINSPYGTAPITFSSFKIGTISTPVFYVTTTLYNGPITSNALSNVSYVFESESKVVSVDRVRLVASGNVVSLSNVYFHTNATMNQTPEQLRIITANAFVAYEYQVISKSPLVNFTLSTPTTTLDTRTDYTNSTIRRCTITNPVSSNTYILTTNEIMNSNTLQIQSVQFFDQNGKLISLTPTDPSPKYIGDGILGEYSYRSSSSNSFNEYGNYNGSSVTTNTGINNIYGEWIQVTFPKNVATRFISFSPSSAYSSPRQIYVVASKDGLYWDIWATATYDVPYSESRTLSNNTLVTYKYFRVIVTEIFNGSMYSIGNLAFYDSGYSRLNPLSNSNEIVMSSSMNGGVYTSNTSTNGYLGEWFQFDFTQSIAATYISFEISGSNVYPANIIVFGQNSTSWEYIDTITQISFGVGIQYLEFTNSTNYLKYRIVINKINENQIGEGVYIDKIQLYDSDFRAIVGNLTPVPVSIPGIYNVSDYRAFDGIDNTAFLSSAPSSIQIKFEYPVFVTHYALVNPVFSEWTFSNATSVIDTRTLNQERTFVISDPSFSNTFTLDIITASDPFENVSLSDLVLFGNNGRLNEPLTSNIQFVSNCTVYGGYRNVSADPINIKLPSAQTVYSYTLSGNVFPASWSLSGADVPFERIYREPVVLSGQVSDSGDDSGAPNAFDNLVTINPWISSNAYPQIFSGVTTLVNGEVIRGDWLQMNLDSISQISTYTITCDTLDTYPTSWLLAYSQDGDTWFTFDTQENIVFTEASQQKSYSVVGNQFLYLRFIIRDVSTRRKCQLQELSFYGFQDIINKAPTVFPETSMTSDTTIISGTTYVASQSSIGLGSNAYTIMNPTDPWYWSSTSGKYNSSTGEYVGTQDTAGYKGEWIQLYSSTGRIPYSYYFGNQSYNDSWVLLASINETDWTLLDEQVGQTTSSSYFLVNYATYNYFRIVVTKVAVTNSVAVIWSFYISYTEPSYKVSYSDTSLSTLYDESGVYKGSSKTGIYFGEWVQMYSSFPFPLTEYSIDDNISNQNMNSWVVLASNDGTTWILIDSRFGIIGTTQTTFFVTNTTSYSYYRIILLRSNGTDVKNLTISNDNNIFMITSTLQVDSYDTGTGEYTGYSSTAGYNGRWIQYTLPEQSVLYAYTVNSIPNEYVMLGSNDEETWFTLDHRYTNTTYNNLIPGSQYYYFRIVVINSSESTFFNPIVNFYVNSVSYNRFVGSYVSSSGDASLAFDSDLNSVWQSLGVDSFTNVSDVVYNGAWIQVNMVTPSTLVYYTLSTPEPASFPTEWIIVGSNDGLNWTLDDSRTSGYSNTYYHTSENFYLSYRMIVLNTATGIPPAIGDLAMYGYSLSELSNVSNYYANTNIQNFICSFSYPYRYYSLKVEETQPNYQSNFLLSDIQLYDNDGTAVIKKHNSIYGTTESLGTYKVSSSTGVDVRSIFYKGSSNVQVSTYTSYNGYAYVPTVLSSNGFTSISNVVTLGKFYPTSDQNHSHLTFPSVGNWTFTSDTPIEFDGTTQQSPFVYYSPDGDTPHTLITGNTLTVTTPLGLTQNTIGVPLTSNIIGDWVQIELPAPAYVSNCILPEGQIIFGSDDGINWNLLPTTSKIYRIIAQTSPTPNVMFTNISLQGIFGRINSYLDNGLTVNTPTFYGGWSTSEYKEINFPTQTIYGYSTSGTTNSWTVQYTTDSRDWELLDTKININASSEYFVRLSSPVSCSGIRIFPNQLLASDIPINRVDTLQIYNNFCQSLLPPLSTSNFIYYEPYPSNTMFTNIRKSSGDGNLANWVSAPGYYLSDGQYTGTTSFTYNNPAPPLVCSTEVTTLFNLFSNIFCEFLFD